MVVTSAPNQSTPPGFPHLFRSPARAPTTGLGVATDGGNTVTGLSSNPFSPSTAKRLRNGDCAQNGPSFPATTVNPANPFTAGNSNSYSDAAKNKKYQPKMSWDQVLENSLSVDEDLLKPKVVRGPCVQVSLDKYTGYTTYWQKTLIIRTLGKAISFKFLMVRLRQLWKLQESFNLVDIGNNFFIVKINNPDDYWHILTGGPWVVAGYYLTVQRWKPFFKPVLSDISSTAVWVRLPGLPLELFQQEVLSDAGNAIGKMVKVDTHTHESSRGKYARICVEIDLTKPLIGEITIGPHIQLVEYEGLDIICFSCGLYGHSSGNCPTASTQAPAKETSAGAQEDQSSAMALDEYSIAKSGDVTPSSDGGLGPWMVVQRRKNVRISNKVAENHDQAPNSRTRFEAIAPKTQSTANEKGSQSAHKATLATPKTSSPSAPNQVSPKNVSVRGKEVVLQDITNSKSTVHVPHVRPSQTGHAQPQAKSKNSGPKASSKSSATPPIVTTISSPTDGATASHGSGALKVTGKQIKNSRSSRNKQVVSSDKEPDLVPPNLASQLEKRMAVTFESKDIQNSITYSSLGVPIINPSSNSSVSADRDKKTMEDSSVDTMTPPHAGETDTRVAMEQDA